jgi:hypothetical protein
MIRQLFAAAAIAAAAVVTAPSAAADDQRYDGDVPGMSYDASFGGPCYSWDVFVFGRGPGGMTEICRYIPNQWPPVYTGFWVHSYPLHGVQEIGAPCPGPKSAAQAPDGRPMRCLGDQGWRPGVHTGDGWFPT